MGRRNPSAALFCCTCTVPEPILPAVWLGRWDIYTVSVDLIAVAPNEPKAKSWLTLGTAWAAIA